MTKINKREFLKTTLLSAVAAGLTESVCTAAEVEKAPQDLVEAVQALREQVDKVFVQEDLQREVELGMFTPAENEPELAAYGRRIGEQVRTELRGSGYTIKDRAAVRIFGQFQVQADTGHITINLTVTRKAGQELKTVAIKRLLRIQTQVESAKEFVLVTAPSMPVEPNVGIENVIAEVQKVKQIEAIQPDIAPLQLDRDSVFLQGAGLRLKLVAVNPEKSPLDREFVLSTIVPSKAIDGGMPFYRLQQAQHFAIELVHNRTDVHLLTEVFVDGVSSFALDDAPIKQEGKLQARFTHWAIPKQKRVLIPGWFKNLNSIYPFQAVPDTDSVAHRLGQTMGLGTIQVLLYAAWTNAEEAEVSSKFKNLTAATRGVGASKETAVRLEEGDLNLGVMLGSLSIRYELQS